MQISLRAAAISLAVAATACAPAVDGPAERQRALDREDGARIAAQIAALPGVVRAEAVVRRPMRDPLAPRAIASAAEPAAAIPTASLAIMVDDRADRAAITAAARMLTRALVPEAIPAIVVEVGALRPRLARVGPFTVEAGSEAPLRATLVAALAVIAALAVLIGRRAGQRAGGPVPRQRRGKSAQ